jgi:hypothetical protein
MVTDFIVDHMVAPDVGECLVQPLSWKLFIVGSVCNQGQGIGCVIESPNIMSFDVSAKLNMKPCSTG